MIRPEDAGGGHGPGFLHQDAARGPRWFKDAINSRPSRQTINVAGAEIELLTWGEAGLPGLLFLHGNGAHADWWSFIAPLFMDRFRCAAISFSGNGRSAWRERYSLDITTDEAIAAICAAHLDETGPPMIIAHSFGGHVALNLGAATDRARGIIIIDTILHDPQELVKTPRSIPTRRYRQYDSAEAIRQRFRLVPPEPRARGYILDHIFKHAIAPTGDGGYRWLADAEWWSKMAIPYDWISREVSSSNLMALRCPFAYMWGAVSEVMSSDKVDYIRGLALPSTPFVQIPGAGHHTFISQPLATARALSQQVEVWLKAD